MPQSACVSRGLTQGLGGLSKPPPGPDPQYGGHDTSEKLGPRVDGAVGLAVCERGFPSHALPPSALTTSRGDLRPLVALF